MRARTLFVVTVAFLVALPVAGQSRRHLNPMIDLLAEGKPVFGLSAPTARGGGGGPGRDASANPLVDPAAGRGDRTRGCSLLWIPWISARRGADAATGLRSEGPCYDARPIAAPAALA